MENKDRNLRVDVLEQGAHNALCAVKLLIAHALRIGAVAAKSWPELKAHALGRADKTIQWTTPDRPVIPRIVSGKAAFLDLEAPATTTQALDTISQMSLKASFVTRLLVRDLRNGSLADLAHLDQNKIRGHASMASAAAVGHKMTTLKDVTEGYVGGSDVSIWTIRAASDWIDSRAPKIAQATYIPRPFAKGELQHYCESRSWDSTDKRKLHSAYAAVRKLHGDELRSMCRGAAASFETPTPVGQGVESKFLPTRALLQKYFC
jgi:hypothetical protein